MGYTPAVVPPPDSEHTALPPGSPGPAVGHAATKPTPAGGPGPEPDAREQVFAIGDEVGHYTISGVLGRGGMGQVYLARDRVLFGREVAIKTLHPGVGEQLLSKNTSVQREARLLARMRHPNIVQIFEFGADERVCWLAMEYVEGTTLAGRVSSGPDLDIPQVVHVLRQVGQALDHAHALGVVHGDIKPANLLLSAAGAGGLFVKVADFGLAREPEPTDDPQGRPSSQGGPRMGTVPYMAPEQLEGRPLGGAADQYALAIVAFALLTGQHPFADSAGVALVRAHVERPPPRPSTLADLPAAIDGVLLRALAKSPEMRFPTCAEFVAALAEALATRPEPTPALEQARSTHPFSDDAWHVTGVVRGTIELTHADGARLFRGEASELLCDLARRIAHRLSEHSGHLQHLAAGELLALFAPDAPRELCAESALDGALAIMAAVDGLHGDPSLPIAVRAEVRLGVDVGVVTGVADAERSAAILEGEPLRRAAALAREASRGEVLASRGALRLVRRLYGAEAHRGGEHYAVRERLRLFADAGEQDAPLRIDASPFVGRDIELALLQRAFDESARASCVVAVPVLGGAGVGKSRLIWELLRALDDDPERAYRPLQGRCSPDRSGSPYEPFSDMVRRLVSGRGEPIDAIRSALRESGEDETSAPVLRGCWASGTNGSASEMTRAPRSGRSGFGRLPACSARTPPMVSWFWSSRTSITPARRPSISSRTWPMPWQTKPWWCSSRCGKAGMARSTRWGCLSAGSTQCGCSPSTPPPQRPWSRRSWPKGTVCLRRCRPRSGRSVVGCRGTWRRCAEPPRIPSAPVGKEMTTAARCRPTWTRRCFSVWRSWGPWP